MGGEFWCSSKNSVVFRFFSTGGGVVVVGMREAAKKGKSGEFDMPTGDIPSITRPTIDNDPFPMFLGAFGIFRLL